MKLKFLASKILYLFVILLVSNKLIAHDNEKVHPRLTLNACNLLTKININTYLDYKTDDLTNGFYDGHEGKNIRQGTIDEDEMALFSFHTRFHFYHAVTGKGWINDTFDNAIVHGEGYWKTALWYYANQDKSNAYYYLGRYLHLLQDLGVPAHVNDDSHISGDDFEAYCKIILKDNPQLFPIGNETSIIGTLANNELYLKNLAEDVYRTIRIQGVLNRNIATPASGNIVNMFPNTTYLTYETDVDVDGNTYEFWRIKDVGVYIPEDEANSEWWECRNFSNDTGKYYYIENSGDAKPVNYPGKSLAQVWATDANYDLLNKAVHYSAGLMKYFHDNASTLYASMDKGTLNGTIVNANTKNPIPDVIVKITGEIDTEITTGSNGTFSIVVPKGSYSVSLDVAGYNYTYCNTEILSNNQTVSIQLNANPVDIANSPVITHTPVTTATNSQSINFAATVTDPQNDVNNVKVYYKVDTGSESSVTMDKQSGTNNYTKAITASGARIYYYVLAEDNNGNTKRYPESVNDWLEIAVTGTTSITGTYPSDWTVSSSLINGYINISIVDQWIYPVYPNTSAEEYCYDFDMSIINVPNYVTIADSVISDIFLNYYSQTAQVYISPNNYNTINYQYFNNSTKPNYPDVAFSFQLSLTGTKSRYYYEYIDGHHTWPADANNAEMDFSGTINYTIPANPVPPAISNVSINPQNIIESNSLTITANIVDSNSGVNNAKLCYKMNDNSEKEIVMQATDSSNPNSFNATIPANDVKYGILSYYISATDNVGARARYPGTNLNTVNIGRKISGLTLMHNTLNTEENIIINYTLTENAYVSFIFYKKEDNKSFELFDNGEAGTNTIEISKDSVLEHGTYDKVTVTARNQQGAISGSYELLAENQEITVDYLTIFGLTVENNNISQWNNVDGVYSIGWSNADNKISGVYYKLDDAPISNTDGTFVESDNLDYTLTQEGQHTLYIWLVGKNGEIDYQKNEAIELKYDKTAPSAPTSLTSDPAGWTKQRQFTISWANPSDLSGIAGAYYKLNGVVPAINTEGTYIAATDGNFFTDLTLTEGLNTLYVWLKDNAENANPANYTAITLRYDTTPPLAEISQPVSNECYSGLITISGSAHDIGQQCSGLQEYSLSYNSNGGPWVPISNSNSEVRYGQLGTWDTSIAFPNANGELYSIKLETKDTVNNINNGFASIYIDNTAPVISNLMAKRVNSKSALIGWQTDDLSDTRLIYGLTSTLAEPEIKSSVMQKNHSVQIDDLPYFPDRCYYKVKSTNKVGLSREADSYFDTHFDINVYQENLEDIIVPGLNVFVKTIKIQPYLTNPEINGCRLYIDETYCSDAIQNAEGKFVFIYNTNVLSDGIHEIKVKTLDSTGVEFIKTVYIVVNNAGTDMFASALMCSGSGKVQGLSGIASDNLVGQNVVGISNSGNVVSYLGKHYYDAIQGPDLVMKNTFMSATYADGPGADQKTITVSAKVSNGGGAAVNNIKAQFFEGDAPSQVQFGGDQLISSLPGFGTKIVSVEKIVTVTGGRQEFKFTVKVDPDLEIPELTEENNDAQKTMVIDPDGSTVIISFRDYPVGDFSKVYLMFDNISVLDSNNEWINFEVGQSIVDLLNTFNTNEPIAVASEILKNGQYTQVKAHITAAVGIRKTDKSIVNLNLINQEVLLNQIFSVTNESVVTYDMDFDLEQSINQTQGGYSFNPILKVPEIVHHAFDASVTEDPFVIGLGKQKKLKINIINNSDSAEDYNFSLLSTVNTDCIRFPEKVTVPVNSSLNAEIEVVTPSDKNMLDSLDTYFDIKVSVDFPSTYNKYINIPFGKIVHGRLIVDSINPRTELFVNGLPCTGNEMTYVSAGTVFKISAEDDLNVLNDNLGFGIKSIAYQIDQNPVTTIENPSPAIGQKFETEFNLANVSQGIHIIRYFVKDAGENIEEKTIAILKDPNEFICKIKKTGGDYATLSAWENAIQCDLTASNVAVFPHNGIMGTIADGVSVIGKTSGAIGLVAHATPSQIMLKNITGNYIPSEYMCEISNEVNKVVIADYGKPVIAVAECYNDYGPAGLIESLEIKDWVTSPANYIKICTPASERHNGTINSGFKITKNSSAADTITSWVNNVWIDGLEIESESRRGFWDRGTTAGGEVKISNCLIHSSAAATGSYAIALQGNGNSKIWNNIITSYGYGIYSDVTGSNNYWYNNTIANCTERSIYGGGQTGTLYKLRNNIINNCGLWTITPASTRDIDYCASNDNTVDTITGGTHNKANQIINFVDAFRNNFNLRPIDTAALNSGIDLSQDPDLSFNTDIHGHPRPSGSAWDVGADEIFDIAAPAKTNTLTATAGTNSREVILSWNSAGDDADTGNLTGKYLIQYIPVSQTNTEHQWQKAQIEYLTANTAPGTAFTYTLNRLVRGVDYKFAFWSEDESGNVSEVSNIVTATAPNLNEPCFYWDMDNVNAATPNIGIGAIVKVNPDNGPITTSEGFRGNGTGINIPSIWNVNRAYFEINPENINPEKGVIDFWYQPDYSGIVGTGKHFFYAVSADNSQFTFLKSGVTGDPLIFYLNSSSNVYTQVPGYTWKAQKGRWYYFKLVWDRENKKAEIWIDGEKRSGDVKNADAWAPIILNKFVIGNKYPEGSYGTASGTIDEFTIHNQIPPATINDLTAQEGDITGQIKLTFTAPGANGALGTLNGKYYVQYSTYTENMNFLVSKAQAVIPAVNVTPGTAQTITLNKLARNYTYYFRVWAQDDEQYISEISNATQIQPKNNNEPFFYWDMENIADAAPNTGIGYLDMYNPNGQITLADGHLNNGVYFPNYWQTSGHYVKISKENIDMDKGVIELWSKGSGNGFFSSSGTTAGRAIYTFMGSNSPYPLEFYVDGVHSVKVQTDAKANWFTEGQWHHYKFVWDKSAGKAEIWINGVKRSGTVQNVNNWAHNDIDFLTIGGRAGYSYNGPAAAMDDFYIYPGTDVPMGMMSVRKSNAPDATFRLNEAYAYPNPAKNGANTKIHIACGIADSVKVNIYNIAGEKIVEQSLDAGSPQEMDGLYCYEYTLEANTVASGVYIYYIIAEKSGEQPIKVIKKCALIK